jgi:DNA-binding FadR family transcriptional regulator
VARPSAVNVIDGLDGPVRHFLTQAGAVDELRQARVMFEVMLARYAADNAAATDIERLGQALAANESSRGDIDAFTATDLGFHLAIAQVPGNSIFLALHHALAGWLAEQRTVSLRAPGALQAASAAHRAIFAAIEAGDADAAEHAMSAHLKEVEQFYRSADADA